MAASFATLTGEEIRQMNEEATPANTNSTSVSVSSEKYSPRRFARLGGTDIFR